MSPLTVNTKVLITDVVCLKFYSDYILAGVGGILKIFSVASSECVGIQEIFEGHRIHGICVDPDGHLLIYGAKDLAVFKLNSDKEEVRVNVQKSISLDDWILTAHWLAKGKEIAIVTAHNVAWLWNWLSHSELKRASCEEKCILYSALLTGEQWEHSLVLAGTVFREVVLWLVAGCSHIDQPVLHRLKGHQGVIFSIAWDWSSSTICTTSDDRSLRTWTVTSSDKNVWKDSKITAKNAFFAHTARVWQSLVIKNTIVSVGEDSRVCVWDANGELLQSWEINCGCVWSLDYSEQHKVLVIGSGDGGIRLFPFPLSPNGAAAIGLCSESILAKENTVRKIGFLNSGDIIATVDDGSVICGRQETATSWRVFHQDARFSNYCVLSISPCRTRFALASLDGNVLFCQSSPLSIPHVFLEEKLEIGKIWSLIWLSPEEILVCGDEGRLSIWRLQENTDRIKCLAHLLLPSSRERWLTCAVLVSKDAHRYLVCGDRCGSVHLYLLGSSTNDGYTAQDHSLPKLHGRFGVTSITDHTHGLISTGRDGTLRFLRIDLVNVKLLALRSDRMVMDWVCNVLLSPEKSLLIVGFKETKMIVWCSRERRTLLEVSCGGGHRSWDCLLIKNNVEIAYVREKHIWTGTWSLDDLQRPSLEYGIHAWEVNCASVLQGDIPILITGGEDGSVAVSKVLKNFSCIVKILTLTSHISSVRCIESFEGFFFSAGGRAMLKAWQLSKESCGDIACYELATHMLKGERVKAATPAVDPEMRYMSICCVADDVNLKEKLLLVVGCSDGALRFLTFQKVNHCIDIIGEANFHSQCVLKVSTIVLPENRVVVLSCATDGCIALWDFLSVISSNNIRPFWSIKSHQSGVNSIHSVLLPTLDRNLVLLASGGDDNAVILKVLLVEGRSVSVVSSWCSVDAHAAQITGIWLVDEWLVSTSVDQRVTVWRWKIDHEESISINCSLLHQCMTYVPDVQDMQLWKNNNHLYVCVVGKGIEVLEIVRDM